MITMGSISGTDTVALAIRICRSKRRMHEAERERVDGIPLRPVIQLLPIDAFVARGVCNGQAAGLGPFKGDETDVAVTHGSLTEEVEAVLWTGGGKGGVC